MDIRDLSQKSEMARLAITQNYPTLTRKLDSFIHRSAVYINSILVETDVEAETLDPNLCSEFERHRIATAGA